MSEKANLINLEILRMAKDLVVNEYVDRRAQLHNKWLRDSEDQFGMIPYPDIPPYPTEHEVTTRAQVLLDFLLNNNSKINITSDSVAEGIGDVALSIIEPTVEPIIENNITGPTGCTEQLVTDCTGPTGTTDLEIKSKPKGRIPLPPDEYAAYARAKVNFKLQDEKSEISKVVPSLLKSINKSYIV